MWTMLIRRLLFIKTYSRCIKRGLMIVVILPWLIAFINLHKEQKQDIFSPIDKLKSVALDTVTYKEGQAVEWRDPYYCNVKCTSNRPCHYKDEVDLRVIVLTYHRKKSLEKCLSSILNLETLNDKVSVDIWIDRSTDDVVDYDSVIIAQQFSNQWNNELSKGRACIHIQNSNAYISGQWVNTWRPKPFTKELALIVEDDILISPLAYKWLKQTHAQFREDNYIAGYTLQSENVNFYAPDLTNIREVKCNRSHTIYLHPIIGTWGFAPHPEAWRMFQDWYYRVRPRKDVRYDYIKPFVPGITPNRWYKTFLERGTQEAMWEMWHTKFTHDFHLFTVYNNLKEFTKRNDVYLSTNRQEKGLHYNGELVVDNSGNLLKQWSDDLVHFPDKKDLVKFNYNGDVCTVHCCFSAVCGNLLQAMWKKSWREIIRLMVPF